MSVPASSPAVSPDSILQGLSALWVSGILSAGVRLNVFGVLADGPKNARLFAVADRRRWRLSTPPVLGSVRGVVRPSLRKLPCFGPCRVNRRGQGFGYDSREG